MSTQISPSRSIPFLLALTLVLLGCQPANPTTAPADVLPTAEPSNSTDNPQVINANIALDPALAEDADSLLICQYLYDGLVRLDSAGTAQPALAESWIVSEDQLDYIFTLKAGLEFSDGSSITPDIIAANFNRWFDKSDPLHKGGNFDTWKTVFLGFNGEKDDSKRPISPVDGIQKVDLRTVLIHLNRPLPQLLTDLANPAFAILSTEALASGSYGTQGTDIVASGPYLISTWSDAGITLSPNPNYSGAAPTADLNFAFP